MCALSDVGLAQSTNVVLLSDHGQMDCTRIMRPNVALAGAGLISLDSQGQITGWDAYCESAGFSAQVYLRDPDSTALQKQVSRLLQGLTQGIGQVLTRGQAQSRHHLAGGFSLVLETDNRTAFSGDCRGELLTCLPSPVGKHGYLPEKGPQPVFWAQGPDFNPGVILDQCDLVDVAPTLARLLGGELPNAQGRVLQAMLR